MVSISKGKEEITVKFFTLFSNYPYSSSGNTSSLTLVTLLIPTIILLGAFTINCNKNVLKTIAIVLNIVIFFYILNTHSLINQMFDSLIGTSSKTEISIGGLIFLEFVIILIIICIALSVWMDKIVDLIANKERKSTKSLSERIEELNYLREKNLISEEEFNQLRGEILNAQVSKNN